jgi:outer membrane protein assembly factor BamB
MMRENGYASHSPVSDGEKVFAFFGASGVHAYDLQGKLLWKAEVGTGLDRRGWGSASSPILCNNLLIVTALVESNALYALDKETGKVVWKQEAKGYSSMWGTPALVEVAGHTELVVAAPGEIWGLAPETGKMLWYCEALSPDSMCSSVLVDGEIVYAVEANMGGGKVAVRAGGSGDVSKTSQVLWSGRENGRIGTPLAYEGRLYWVSGGVVNCLDMQTGERVYQGRLSGSSGSAAGGRPGGLGASGGPGGFGFRGGMGGGRGGQDYSSAVAADGKLYFVRRSGETAVIKLGDKFEPLATNKFEEGGDFSATPAISNGEIFIRSSKTLYCIAEQK